MRCSYYIFSDNRDKVETYLAFGATRMEACKPIAVDALRLALTPVINQMRSACVRSSWIFTSFLIAHNVTSVLGIIAIPGMMTGAILGGSSVSQAAKLQMIIMFCISASTALAAMFTTVCAISVVVDEEHRVRPDRIYSQGPGFTSNVLVIVKGVAGRTADKIQTWFGRRVAAGSASETVEERELLMR